MKINYIRAWDALKPVTDGNSITVGVLPNEFRMTTQYLDGLGRPVQQVTKQGSLTTGDIARDMVSAVVYDEFGREAYKYLPFTANNTGGNAHIQDGLFKLNPFQQEASFCQGQYPGETYFYSKALFEASPLNRVIKTFAPGNNWVGQEGVSETTCSNWQDPNIPGLWHNRCEPLDHSVKVKYQSNTGTDDIKIWSVTSPANGWGTYSVTGSYLPGELSKTITQDEHNKQVIEFKDKGGKIILKKVQLTAAIDFGEGSTTSYMNWLCTYYIYDDQDRLRCIIQPAGVEELARPAINWILTTNLLNEQCFRYEYDHRGRMITKKIPGAGEVYMVYDARDRLVMTQDANLRESGKWMVTKYDELNRPVETGLWASSISVADHRTAAAASTDYPATGSGYDVLTITHYDNYTGIPDGWSSSFDGNWSTYFNSTYNTAPDYAQPQAASSQTRGLVTWTQARVLGTSTFLSAVNIYDDKSRVIQVKATNLLGKDIVTTQYSWSGQPLVIVQNQQITGTNAQTSVIVTKLTYDDLGRVIKAEKKLGNTLVNSGAMSDYATIYTLEYNALGQVKKKTIGNRKDPSTNQYTIPREPLQELSYDYNIRGWLLGMNRDYLAAQGQTSDGKLFGFELGYDKTANKTGQSFNSQQFNGNITGMVWKSDGDDIRRKYDFGYDAANRLLKADFVQQNDDGLWNNFKVNFDVKMGNGSSPTDAYDANGNIKRMQQWGLKLGGSDQIDDLRYEYFDQSNKLKKVEDLVTADQKLGDFTDKNTTATDYGYDKNGNLVTDLNKRIGSTTGTDITSGGAITYNYLNLPTEILIKDDNGTSKGKVTYTYDAEGNKLRKETIEYASTANNHIATTTITDYVNGSIYETKTDDNANTTDYTNKLQFLGQEEGRIRYKEAAGATAAGFEYDYMIKDYLGNVRMVLTEESKTDSYTATMETGNQSIEEQVFTKIPETQADKPAGFDSDGSNNKVSKLLGTASTDHRVGPGVVLKVMAGDRFRAGVKGWYEPGVTNPNTASQLGSIVDALIGAFTGGIPAGGNHGQGSGAVPGSTELNGPLGQFVTGYNNSTGSDVPKAYLNWILLDEEQFKLVEGNYGAVPVPEITGTMGKQVMLANGGADMEVKKNGYLYVYVSNASKGNVYFDELSVVHSRGSLLEETHYYPFGLIMTGISSKALISTLENKYKFNDGNELQNKEFSDGSGLEVYDAQYRMYDPQIGKFMQADPLTDLAHDWSPYVFANNNPIILNDPAGLLSDSTKPVPKPAPQPAPDYINTPETAPVLGEVVMQASRKSPLQGGDFNNQYFSDIKNEFSGAWGYSRVQRKDIIEHTDLTPYVENFIKEGNRLAAIYGFGSALAGGSILDWKAISDYKSFLKLLKSKGGLKSLLKLNPLSIAIGTILGIRSSQMTEMNEQLLEVYFNYIKLHAEDPSGLNGIYRIYKSYSVGTMGGSGGAETTSFYDKNTKTFLGEVSFKY